MTGFDAATYIALADAERRRLDPLAALVAARQLRDLIDQAVVDAVLSARQARAAGAGAGRYSWSEIGDALGTSRQAAQQRYGLFADLADGAEIRR